MVGLARQSLHAEEADTHLWALEALPFHQGRFSVQGACREQDIPCSPEHYVVTPLSTGTLAVGEVDFLCRA